MQQQDIEIVVAIERSANQFPWSLKNFEDSLRAGHQAWTFYDERDEILGFAIIQKVVDETHLLNIGIKPSLQGKGLGREILQHVINYSKQISSNLIVLEVRRSNIRAQNLYIQAGFNEMSIRKNYYPAENGREDAVLMGMDLGLMSFFKEK